MAHATNVTKEFNVNALIDIKDIMEWEFDSYHHKTFTFKIDEVGSVNRVTATGLEFLVNWLEFLIDLETERLVDNSYMRELVEV